MNQVESVRAHSKLEALELWLADRIESAVSVGVVANERRCTIRAHGLTFEGVAPVTTPETTWWATWCAIISAIALCEQFERARGSNVG